MPSKKSTAKKTKQSRGAKRARVHGAPPTQAHGAKLTRVHRNPAPPLQPPSEEAQSHGGEIAFREITNGSGRRKRPYYFNPETGEDREKRLAARKALTLRAFEMAYENNHRRKAS